MTKLTTSKYRIGSLSIKDFNFISIYCYFIGWLQLFVTENYFSAKCFSIVRHVPLFAFIFGLFFIVIINVQMKRLFCVVVTPSKYNLNKNLYKSYFNIAKKLIHFGWWTVMDFCLNIETFFALVCYYRIKSLFQKTRSPVYAIWCLFRSPITHRVNNQTLRDTLKIVTFDQIKDQ